MLPKQKKKFTTCVAIDKNKKSRYTFTIYYKAIKHLRKHLIIAGFYLCQKFIGAGVIS